MQTLQQRRHQDLIAQLAKENERRDTLIVRLGRSDAKVQKLRRAIVRSSKRLDIARINAPLEKPAPYQPGQSLAAKIDEAMHGEGEGDAIPTFLKRNEANRLAKLPDPKAPDKKAERRAVQEEIKQAQLTGKRRKMPLTGKAALAAITSAG